MASLARHNSVSENGFSRLNLGVVFEAGPCGPISAAQHEFRSVPRDTSRNQRWSPSMPMADRRPDE